jgi:DNA helicase HerA-like ATPase
MKGIAKVVAAASSRKRMSWSVVACTFAIANWTYVVVVLVWRDHICGDAYGIGVRRRHCGSLLIGIT